MIVLTLLLLTVPTVLGSIDAGQASTGMSAISNALIGGIQEFIRRSPPTNQKTSPMYDRKTQSPLVWIHLRKAPRIVVDNEFYNISAMPGMNETNWTNVLVPVRKFVLPEIQHMMPRTASSMKVSSPPSAFVETKVDPLMIQNGLYLSMPLRNPPQETVNIVAAEDTNSIQAIADTFRKKREIKRLNSGFNKMIREIAMGG